MRPLTSQNQYNHRGIVPDPKKAGWLKYDKEAYIKILKQEAQKRQSHAISALGYTVNL
jgi:hypothetical protein